MLTRRHMLFTSFASLGLAATSVRAEGLFSQTGLRGARDGADEFALPPGEADGSKRFMTVLKAAAARGRPVFLPPGTYRISNIELPDNAEIIGVPGTTRIDYTGDGHLFLGRNLRRLRLSGITIDGGNRWLGDYAGGLLHFTGVEQLEIEGCDILGAGKNALHLEGCGGEIRANHISGAADAGIYAVESARLAIRDNDVSACGNGGILVHRYRIAEDGTMVTGNRVSAIRARAGGTGQNGNGINIFRAGNVIVSNNQVSDCAFSAIRANSASGVQIGNNQCLRSGETAIYSEFSFEGAMVSNNIVDGAANGISIVNFNEGGRLAVVNANIIRNILAKAPYPPLDAGFGIGIAAEADTVISANVIENTGKWGMLLGWGPYLRNLTVTGNLVRQVPVGCAVSVADGAASTLIADNTFAETRELAIAGYRWNERATGELVVTADTGFAHLTIERNRLS